MSGVEEIGAASGRASPVAVEAISVTRFLLDLRALGEGPAPEPSDELAALIGPVPPDRVPPRPWTDAEG